MNTRCNPSTSFPRRFRHWRLLAALALTTTSLAVPDAKAAPAKPNIILILADDLGVGDVGMYGSKLSRLPAARQTGVHGADREKISTPHINRVFAEGRRYFNAHSPSAVCSPTRFAVLTGAYPWRENRVPRHLTAGETLALRDGEPTVASLLKQAGYATACIGKWHLGAQHGKAIDWNKPLSPGPNQFGFDRFFGVINSHNQAPFVWVDNLEVMGRLPGESIEIEGNRKEVKGIQFKRRIPEISATLAQRATQFIEENKDRPFFLYYPACTVHSPHEPMSKFKDTSGVGAYGDSAQEFDWQVGRILAALSRHKLHERTLLIVTSDNGAAVAPGRKHGHASNARLRGQKAGIYEGGHRVPFVARWKGTIPAASDSTEIISLVDFLATACAAAGVELPAHLAPDSHNLLPEMTGETLKAAIKAGASAVKPIREATISASKFQNHLAIRQGPWKLITVREPVGDAPLAPYKPGQFGPDKPELYRLASDPGETLNLYDNHKDVAERLTALLEKIEKQGFSRPGFQPDDSKQN